MISRIRMVGPRALLRAGVAYIPQGNRVFSDLTVRENFQVGATSVIEPARYNDAIERVLTLFPVLKHRLQQRAGTLSGGEQQMVALANAFIVSPRLLLLDEPSLGLAPPLAKLTLESIRHIGSANGTAVLIVEQKVREVLRIATRVYVLRNGAVSFAGPTADLDETQVREVFL